MAYVLAAYELDLGYGGPEEGGWWFTSGRLVRAIAVVHGEDNAYALARRANKLMQHLQRNRRPVSSAAYDGGRYSIEVYKDKAPDYFPEHRPHYE